MKIYAIRNNILFQFLDETKTADGKFIERTRGSIIIGSVRDNQNSQPRWGKVLSVGPEAFAVKEGDFILIEPGKWTVGTEIDGVKMWKTDENCVICTTTEESDTYSY